MHAFVAHITFGTHPKRMESLEIICDKKQNKKQVNYIS